MCAKGLCTTHYQRYKSGRHSYLEPYVTAWNKLKTDRTIQAQERAYKKSLESRRTPEYRDATRYRRYGIDEASFLNMLAEQRGLCKICKLQLTQGKTYIDHCHITNKVRGLLCPGCNTMLGVIENKFDLIGVALEYIGTYGQMLNTGEDDRPV